MADTRYAPTLTSMTRTGISGDDETFIMKAAEVSKPLIPPSGSIPPLCLNIENAKCSDEVHPRAPVSPTVNLEPLCTVPTLGSEVQQQNPSTVAPSDVAFQGPSVCTFSIPDPPVDGVHIIVNHSEEREGVATEGVQTLSGLVSPSTSPTHPVHGSSLRKRRAENKKTGMTKRPRQIDYGENPVILEYYQILIQKEKQAMKMAVEKDRLATEKDRLATEKDRLAMERDRLAMERDRLAMERDRQLIEMGRQAARYFAVNAEISEQQKQRLEAELKDYELKDYVTL